MTGYIYLGDIKDWTVDHPEAVKRLHEQAPEGAVYSFALADGAMWEVE